MIWIDSINELDYYHPQLACYCELVIKPNDISLQVPLGLIDRGENNYFLSAFTADGLELIVNFTDDNFDINEFNVGEYRFANITFYKFPEEICANPCFILKLKIQKTITSPSGSITVTTIFDKYTQKFCAQSCCFEPEVEIEVNPEEIVGMYDPQDYDTLNDYQ